MNPHHSFHVEVQRRGVALVIVLAMLVLLSALLVAFMSTATTERAASYANAGVTTARQIADSTVSLVISQIRDATSVPDETTTWASQPGAIRTFSGSLSGERRQLKEAAYYDGYKAGSNDFTYKLYSADRMKMRTSEYETDNDGGLPGETKIIEDWQRFDPLKDYVDLNDPVLSPRRDLTPAGSVVEPHYPIIDPRAAYDANENPVATSGGGIVQGFDAKLTLDQDLQLPSKAKVPYLPMPVKWLYVLQDGSIGPASRATEKNPIVGRTAFWTDDESCKLNINTASEGTFWDTPTVSIAQESGVLGGGAGVPTLSISTSTLSLAASQPVKGEYQRYPGHPMTTCLSPALGWLWGLNATTPVWPSNLPYRTFKEAIYKISPFLAFGNPTSQGASMNTDAWLDPSKLTQTTVYWDAPSQSIKLDVPTKHLYTSVDEMLFKPRRFTPGGGLQPPELNEKVTPEALEKLRFFLSATSRAPELNLFGRPRVTLWPVHTDFARRTQFDDLFLFTSTISKGANDTNESDDVRYNILRHDAKSAQNDFTPNVKIFEYLQRLTSKSAPGYGGSLETSWGGPIDRDSILNLIFDYTRTVNLVDTGIAGRSRNEFIPYTPRFFRAGLEESYGRQARSTDWSGQVTPLRVNASGYQGLGRFPVITEVALIFYASSTEVAPVKPAVRAMLAMELGNPMAGFPALRETYFTTVRAEQDVEFKFTSSPEFVPMGFRNAPLINICNVSSHEVTFGRAYIPSLGFTAPFHWFPDHKFATEPEKFPNAQLDPARNNSFSLQVKQFTNKRTESLNYARGETVKYYPYVSEPMEVPAGQNQTFNFKNGRFVIEVWSGEAPPGDRAAGFDPRAHLVQRVHVQFPPELEVKNMAVPTAANSPEFRTRFDLSLDGAWNCTRPGDVIRSMELTCGGQGGTQNTAGDKRLALARTDVPDWFFAPRDGPTVYGGAIRQLHGLCCGHGDPVTGHTGPGRLAMNGGYRASKPPILPKSVNGVAVNGVFRADGGPGDWDRGLSKHMSGALGNKVDEGNLRFNYADGSPAGRIPYYRGRAIEETGQTFFSPNRQLPSAVMLGSLPTGVVGAGPQTPPRPWQTLLFRPNRESPKSHPGAGGPSRPPDHLVLDLFNVPIVEPYAISEPFSTAGKVNLNHVLAPFGYAKGVGGVNPGTDNERSYIRRDTALRGVLKPVFVMAVPTGATEGGHTEDPHTISAGNTNFRFPIDLDRTLGAIETRLKAKDTQLFRSASEICTVDLYPAAQGAPGAAPNVSNWNTFWNTTYALTGDNMRERPYALIYPRVTTKSNVYTVHMRCQAIRKAAKSKVDEFDPELDQVIGDYRGSATVERFIDPNDAALIKYDDNNEKVDPYYRYRVVNTKHFSPR